MRIAYISPYPPEKEGVGDYLALLLAELREAGNDIEVTVFAQPDSTVPQDEFVMSGTIVRRTWKPNSLTALLRLRDELQSGDFDLVHLEYGPYSKYGGFAGETLLIPFLGLAKRHPILVTLHSLWFPDLLKLRLSERCPGRPWLTSLAGWLFNTYFSFFCRLFKRVVLLTNVATPTISKRVSNSFGLSPDKLVVWVHPSPTPKSFPLSPIPRERVPASVPFRVVCPGFISARKGIETAIDAIEGQTISRRFELTIVGECLRRADVEYLERLKKQYRESIRLGRLKFKTDPVDSSALELAAQSADAVVLTHSYRVGPSGLVARLASVGVPLIATSDPNFLPGPTTSPFILVPPRDRIALGRELESLATEPDRVDRLSTQLREWATTNSYAAHARNHLKLYTELVRESA